MRAAVECQACSYRWEAIAEEPAPEVFECPACGQMAGQIPTDAEYAEWSGYLYASGRE